MPRKSGTLVGKDDSATARGADNSEHNKTPRRSSRASVKKEQFSTSEGRRSQRSSTAAQTAASVAESRVTRSRNSITPRKENSQTNNSNIVIGKDGLETPASRVKSTRRSTGRINYRESDGEEELQTPGNETGYSNDMSFGEQDSEGTATNKKKRSSQSLSTNKPTRTKLSISLHQLNNEADEEIEEQRRSISSEENVEATVSTRKRNKETNDERESLHLRRSSRRARQASDSIEPDGREAGRISRSSENKTIMNKRPVRGKAKSDAEVSEQSFQVLEIDTSQSKCEKMEIDSSGKRKISSDDSVPNKKLKTESKVENTLGKTASEDEDVTELETEDEKNSNSSCEHKICSEDSGPSKSLMHESKVENISIETAPEVITELEIEDETKVVEHESSIQELAEGGSSIKKIPISKEDAPESMDIDEPIRKSAQKLNSDAAIKFDDVKCESDISSNKPSEKVVSTLKSSPETEEINQSSHSGDETMTSLNKVGTDVEKKDKCVYLENADKNQHENSKTKSVKDELISKEKHLEPIDVKCTVTDCQTLVSDKSENACLKNNSSDHMENDKETVHVPEVLSNLGGTVSKEPDSNTECKSETSIDHSLPKIKCAEGKCDTDLEFKNDEKLKGSDEDMKECTTTMKVTSADKNVSSNNVFVQTNQSLETSRNGSELTNKPIISSPNILLPSVTETNVETIKPTESTTAKANGAHTTSHAVDNILTKETSFFFPGRRYVLNPSMTEEIRFSLKNRMIGFASFNLGCKIRNCSSQKDKLISELRKLQSDVICLQEITKSFFHDILEPSLAALGYKGIIHVPEENFTGLASFYKNSTMKLSSFSEASLLKLIEKDLEASSLEPCDKTAVLSYLKKCGNVLFTQFSTVSGECTLTVANVSIPPSDISTHALQMSCLVREVVTMIEGSTKPLLLCGAFNMAEDEASYQLLRDGYLSNEMIEELQKEKDVQLPGKENAALINLLWKAFQHPSSNLCSCYASVLGHELLVTGGQKSVSPDLLWFSSDCLQTVGVLDVVSAPPEKMEDFHYSLKATVAFSLQRK